MQAGPAASQRHHVAPKENAAELGVGPKLLSPWHAGGVGLEQLKG